MCRWRWCVGNAALMVRLQKRGRDSRKRRVRGVGAMIWQENGGEKSVKSVGGAGCLCIS